MTIARFHTNPPKKNTSTYINKLQGEHELLVHPRIFLRLFSPNLTTWQVIHWSNTFLCLYVSSIWWWFSTIAGYQWFNTLLGYITSVSILKSSSAGSDSRGVSLGLGGGLGGGLESGLASLISTLISSICWGIGSGALSSSRPFPTLAYIGSRGTGSSFWKPELSYILNSGTCWKDWKDTIQ